MDKKKLCTSKINIFKHLDYENQVKLYNTIQHVKVEAGKHFISEGDKSDFIYVIHKGSVKLTRYDNFGKENIIDLLNEIDTIGEESFFEKEFFEYNAIAITDIEMCKISKDELNRLLKKDSLFSFQIVQHLSNKIKKTNEMINILMENDTLNRLIFFILEYSDDDYIRLGIDDIAAAINIRRETVSRKLSILQKDNLIERIGRNKIKIINRDNLLKYYFLNK